MEPTRRIYAEGGIFYSKVKILVKANHSYLLNVPYIDQKNHLIFSFQDLLPHRKIDGTSESILLQVLPKLWLRICQKLS